MISPDALYAFQPHVRSECAAAGSSARFFSMTERTPRRVDGAVGFASASSVLSTISTRAEIGLERSGQNSCVSTINPILRNAKSILRISLASPSVPATCGSPPSKSCHSRKRSALGTDSSDLSIGESEVGIEADGVCARISDENLISAIATTQITSPRPRPEATDFQRDKHAPSYPHNPGDIPRLDRTSLPIQLELQSDG